MYYHDTMELYNNHGIFRILTFALKYDGTTKKAPPSHNIFAS